MIISPSYSTPILKGIKMIRIRWFSKHCGYLLLLSTTPNRSYFANPISFLPSKGTYYYKIFKIFFFFLGGVVIKFCFLCCGYY